MEKDMGIRCLFFLSLDYLNQCNVFCFLFSTHPLSCKFHNIIFPLLLNKFYFVYVPHFLFICWWTSRQLPSRNKSWTLEMEETLLPKCDKWRMIHSWEVWRSSVKSLCDVTVWPSQRLKLNSLSICDDGQIVTYLFTFIVAPVHVYCCSKTLFWKLSLDKALNSSTIPSILIAWPVAINQ